MDKFFFIIHFPAVADEAVQPYTAGLGKFHDTFADVVCRIHGYHLAGNYDVDLLVFLLSPACNICFLVVQEPCQNIKNAHHRLTLVLNIL